LSERILVVDDEAGIRDAFALLLEDAGYEPIAVPGALEALALLVRGEAALVLCDVAMPGMDGIALVERLHQAFPGLPVVMVSAHGELETAVRAVRAGAYDFLQKPVDEKRLFVTIERALEWARMRRDLHRLRTEQEGDQELLGESPPMRRLREEIRRAAPSDSRILVLGEAGTGKELVARAIHEGSRRRDQPFVKVNSAAIPRDLVESELFGHEAGAFTGATKARRGKFEQADRGTLFLDEIADMAPEAQAKLLRVLASGEVERVGGTRPVQVDVRVICATNRDLTEEIRDGAFREDLYHRVAVIPIVVPSLRERGPDILLLAERFLIQFSAGYREAPPILETDARERLLNHPWPGNVREVRNLAERIAIMHDRLRVTAEDLDRYLAPPEMPAALHPAQPHAGTDAHSPARPPAGPGAEDWKSRRSEMERSLLETTLTETGWNVTLAAERLGMDRASLSRKLRRYGVERPGRRPGESGA
jgi:two-component system, NtrC family, nitrogen regulation response regulator NtrX